MEIPEALAWLAATPDGAAWLRDLPALLRRVVDRWDLELGPPFSGGNVSFVAPARRRGRAVVLKVQWPHREVEHEAEALRRWNGEGAIRLLAVDDDHHALLLERCLPGTPLSSIGGEAALDVIVELLPRLWKPATAPFRTLVAEAGWWAAGLADAWEEAGRPCERRLVDAALEWLGVLAPTGGESFLLHQDLHGDNVLAAQRSPWLAIDPKPLVGERSFSAAPIVRSFELGHRRRDVLWRLDRLCAELGLDRDRARGWAIAQTMAWSFEGEYTSWHHDTVRWLLAS